MDMFTVIASFFVILLIMLAPCASDQVNNVRKYDEDGEHGIDHVKFMLPLLPRKLKHDEEVKSVADKYFMPHKKLMMKVSSGDKKHVKEENVMHAKGTWREWVEGGPDKSEYYTMDYGWVRKRRPIHNKQIPFNHLP